MGPEVAAVGCRLDGADGPLAILAGAEGLDPVEDEPPPVRPRAVLRGPDELPVLQEDLSRPDARRARRRRRGSSDAAPIRRRSDSEENRNSSSTGATAVDGDGDEQPQPAIVPQQGGIGRRDISQQDVGRASIRPGSARLGRARPSGDPRSRAACRRRRRPRTRTGTRGGSPAQGRPRRAMAAALVELDVADGCAPAAPVVVLEEDEAAAVALKEKRVGVEATGRRSDQRQTLGVGPPVRDEPLLLAEPAGQAPAHCSGCHAPQEGRHRRVRRRRPLRLRRSSTRHAPASEAMKGQPRSVEVAKPPGGEVGRPARGPAATAVKREPIGLDDRAVDGALAVRTGVCPQGDGGDEFVIVHLPEELRLAGASPQPARVQRPRSVARASGEPFGGDVGREAQQHVELLRGDGRAAGVRGRVSRELDPARAGATAALDRHPRQGVVGAPEPAPVGEHVRVVEQCRAAPAAPRLRATRPSPENTVRLQKPSRSISETAVACQRGDVRFGEHHPDPDTAVRLLRSMAAFRAGRPSGPRRPRASGPPG